MPGGREGRDGVRGESEGKERMAEEREGGMGSGWGKGKERDGVDGGQKWRKEEETGKERWEG